MDRNLVIVLNLLSSAVVLNVLKKGVPFFLEKKPVSLMLFQFNCYPLLLLERFFNQLKSTSIFHKTALVA